MVIIDENHSLSEIGQRPARINSLANGSHSALFTNRMLWNPSQPNCLDLFPARQA